MKHRIIIFVTLSTAVRITVNITNTPQFLHYVARIIVQRQNRREDSTGEGWGEREKGAMDFNTHQKKKNPNKNENV